MYVNEKIHNERLPYVPDVLAVCVQLVLTATGQGSSTCNKYSEKRLQHKPVTSMSDVASSDIETSDTATEAAEI